MPSLTVLAAVLATIPSISAENFNKFNSAHHINGTFESYQDQDSLNATPDQRTIVCRSVTTLRTRIPKRICRTKAEWLEAEKSNQQALEKFNRRF